MMTSKMNLKKSDAPSINIQSYIRVRPLGPKEKRATNLELGKREVTIKSSAESSKLSKTLTFDRVFDEDSKQIVVYNTVVKPMIKEVLQGYNCTVFAYGQTGTGKTYTMTGEQSDFHTSWEENVHAGIIPRAMQDIFSELANQPGEYQVSVSYMELYNEKLRSLLKDSSDESNIKLIDDNEGGIIFKGLLPSPIKTKEEGFKLLQQGAERRQIAATMMNMNSSRSHTIFTINVNIKENVVAGKDDVLRCGKLHLVDLAGSENVSKSGASENIHKTATGVNKRLAEASNINKSLLTLGRVITCLTENHPHIPYRESKLTRFLRDSLGGKTKTCIVGTISPAHFNLDETESTLNYAYKARSIKNKPEKNQTISKKDFMQVASEEIMKLKKDLEAVRQGEGFYISKESHEEMISRMKELDNQVKDWHEKYSRIKESYEQTKELFSSLSADFDDKCAEYEELEKVFQTECDKFREKLSDLNKEIVVREYFIKQYEKTENKLTEQAKTCKSVLETVFEQSHQLHDKIDRKRSNEAANIKTLNSFKENADKKFKDVQAQLNKNFDEEKQFVTGATTFVSKIFEMVTDEKEKLISCISSLENKISGCMQAVKDKSLDIENQLSDDFKYSVEFHEETWKSLLSTFRELMDSMILPSFKNLKHQFCLLVEDVENGKNILQEYENRQSNLLCNIDKNHQNISELLLNSLHEIADIRKHNEETSTGIEKIHSISETVSEKGKKMMKLVEEIQRDYALIKNNVLSIAASSASSDEKAEFLQGSFQSNLKQSESEHSEFMEKMEKETKERVTCQDNIINKIEEKIKCLSIKEDSRLSEMQVCFDKKIGEIQLLSEEEKKNLYKLEDGFKQFSDFFSKTTIDYEDSLKTSLDGIKAELQQSEVNLESLLREKQSLNNKKLKNIQQNHEVTQSIIRDFHQEIKTISYSQDISLGTTPQRISKENLNYPQKFESTAPRSELAKRLRELHIENESGGDILPKLLCNGEIEISKDRDSPPRNESKSKISVEESSNFDEKCTPKAQSNTLRRKSSSMPDLKSSTEGGEFLAPYQVQNKENFRNTRSERKCARTKIPDSKSKKKTVLGAVQDSDLSFISSC